MMDKYSTTNTDEATALVYAGYNIEDIQVNEKKQVVFTFVSSSDLLKEQLRYANSSLKVNLKAYMNTLRKVKKLVKLKLEEDSIIN